MFRRSSVILLSSFSEINIQTFSCGILVLTKISRQKDSTQLQFYVLAKTRNEPKPPETSQNESKTSRDQQKQPQKIAKQSKMTQNSNIAEIWNFLVAFIFQILNPNGQISGFWVRKYQLLDLNQISHWFSKVLSPNCEIRVFWAKKYQPSDLHKILPVSYFKGAGSKFDFHFRKRGISSLKDKLFRSLVLCT